MAGRLVRAGISGGGIVKEKPILFSGAMVLAILDGGKTQTRRVVKPQPSTEVLVHGPKGIEKVDTGAWDWRCKKGAHKCLGTTWEIIYRELMAYAPYGQSGDRLWVKETFAILPEGFTYRADDHGQGRNDLPSGVKWKPSILCSRKASRLTLEIVSVRVERLQEISEEDAESEGAPWLLVPLCDEPQFAGLEFHGHKVGYAHLWESINGPGSWAKNPYVWIIEFKRL